MECLYLLTATETTTVEIMIMMTIAMTRIEAETVITVETPNGPLGSGCVGLAAFEK